MKAIKTMIIILMTAVTLVAPRSGLAAIQLPRPLKVSIPFNFNVGKTQLPAGKYVVDRVTPNAISIRNLENWKSAITLTFGGESKLEPPRSQLVFTRYNELYFLTRIWDGTSTASYQLPKTQTEREAERQLRNHLAQQGRKPSVVSVMSDPES